MATLYLYLETSQKGGSRRASEYSEVFLSQQPCIKINADLNGCANILNKVKEQLNLDLAKTCRGLLTVPQRIFLWKNNCKKRRGMDARLPRSNSLNHREF
jgi:hypothetical protein